MSEFGYTPPPFPCSITVIQKDGKRGLTFPLQRKDWCLLGANEDCDIRVPFKDVAPLQALVFVKENGVFLQGIDSTIPVVHKRLEKDLVAEQEVPLTTGDTFFVGEREFTVEYENPNSTEATGSQTPKSSKKATPRSRKTRSSNRKRRRKSSILVRELDEVYVDEKQDTDHLLTTTQRVRLSDTGDLVTQHKSDTVEGAESDLESSSTKNQRISLPASEPESSPEHVRMEMPPRSNIVANVTEEATSPGPNGEKPIDEDTAERDPNVYHADPDVGSEVTQCHDQGKEESVKKYVMSTSPKPPKPFARFRPSRGSNSRADKDYENLAESEAASKTFAHNSIIETGDTGVFCSTIITGTQHCEDNLEDISDEETIEMDIRISKTRGITPVNSNGSNSVKKPQPPADRITKTPSARLSPHSARMKKTPQSAIPETRRARDGFLGKLSAGQRRNLVFSRLCQGLPATPRRSESLALCNVTDLPMANRVAANTKDQSVNQENIVSNGVTVSDCNNTGSEREDHENIMTAESTPQKTPLKSPKQEEKNNFFPLLTPKARSVIFSNKVLEAGSHYSPFRPRIAVLSPASRLMGFNASPWTRGTISSRSVSPLENDEEAAVAQRGESVTQTELFYDDDSNPPTPSASDEEESADEKSTPAKSPIVKVGSAIHAFFRRLSGNISSEENTPVAKLPSNDSASASNEEYSVSDNSSTDNDSEKSEDQKCTLTEPVMSKAELTEISSTMSPTRKLDMEEKVLDAAAAVREFENDVKNNEGPLDVGRKLDMDADDEKQIYMLLGNQSNECDELIESDSDSAQLEIEELFSMSARKEGECEASAAVEDEMDDTRAEQLEQTARVVPDILDEDIESLQALAGEPEETCNVETESAMAIEVDDNGDSLTCEVKDYEKPPLMAEEDDNPTDGMNISKADDKDTEAGIEENIKIDEEKEESEVHVVSSSSSEARSSEEDNSSSEGFELDNSGEEGEQQKEQEVVDHLDDHPREEVQTDDVDIESLRQELQSLKVVELRSRLVDLSLSTVGKKRDLVERLTAHTLNPEHDEEAAGTDSDQEGSSEKEEIGDMADDMDVEGVSSEVVQTPTSSRKSHRLSGHHVAFSEVPSTPQARIKIPPTPSRVSSRISARKTRAQQNVETSEENVAHAVPQSARTAARKTPSRKITESDDENEEASITEPVEDTAEEVDTDSYKRKTMKEFRAYLKARDLDVQPKLRKDDLIKHLISLGIGCDGEDLEKVKDQEAEADGEEIEEAEEEVEEEAEQESEEEAEQETEEEVEEKAHEAHKDQEKGKASAQPTPKVPEQNKKSLMKLTVAGLRLMLSERGLCQVGTKKVLVERLSTQPERRTRRAKVTDGTACDSCHTGNVCDAAV